MFLSKKPKFKLELGINELSNIPQVSGNCYIDLQIRDNKRIKSLPFNFPFKNGNDTDDSLNSSLSLSTPNPLTNSNSKSNLNSNSSSSVSAGNVSITTGNKKIHNFKCSFNYKIGCNLKFGIKRRDNLINDKFLIMRIFYVSDQTNSKDFGSIHHNRLELGKIEINLTEYLNFNEPITSKYLLKDSKVNSILGLSIHLSELPSNFDFHTQLTINDNIHNGNNSNNSSHTPTQLGHSDSKLMDRSKTSIKNSATSSKYNIPQFEGKNIFGGLNDVIGSEQGLKETRNNNNNNKNHNNNSNGNSNNGTKNGSKLNSQINSNVGSLSSDNESNSGNLNSKKSDSLRIDTTGSNTNQIVKQQFQQQSSSIMIDPIVNDLYRKILESTWDPNLHILLDFTPEVCVDSIFDGTFAQWDEKLRLAIATTKEEDDDEIRCIHGLVNELNYRDDLKSWNISEVKS